MAIAAKLDNVREGLVLMLQFVCLLAGVCAVCLLVCVPVCLCVWKTQTQTMSVGTSPILCPSDKSGGVVVAGRQKDSFQRHSPSQLAALTPRSRPLRHQTSPIRISPRISWNSQYISVLRGNSWLMPLRFLMMDIQSRNNMNFELFLISSNTHPIDFYGNQAKFLERGDLHLVVSPRIGHHEFHHSFTFHRSPWVSPVFMSFTSHRSP